MRSSLFILCASLMLLASCENSSEPETSADPRLRYALQALPQQPEYPRDNPRNKERFLLGWRLFYDPILSGTKDVACGTCHHPLHGMSDAREFSLGVNAKGLGPKRYSLISANTNVAARHSLSVINMAFIKGRNGHSPFFWDGRAHSLEEQSLFPIQNASEMAGREIATDAILDTILERLREIKLYQVYFKNAFPEQADSVTKGLLPSVISKTTLTKALASFQREVISVNSPFDLYARGNDTAMTTDAKRGLDIFFGKAACGSCHNGPMLSDFEFYGQGIGKADDLGEGNNRFRTPSLRNLKRTAPFMHDGSLKTIEDVIEYYDRGIPLNASLPKSNIDPRFKPLSLTNEEKRLLEEFLLSLTDDSWEQYAVPPSNVPSNLEVPR